MSSFTQQLQLRHTGQSELVKPRQRSLFEPMDPHKGQLDMGFEVPKQIPPFQQPGKAKLLPGSVDPMHFQPINVAEHSFLENRPDQTVNNPVVDSQGQMPVITSRKAVFPSLALPPILPQKPEMPGKEGSLREGLNSHTNTTEVAGKQMPPVFPPLVSPRPPEFNNDWMQALKTAANTWQAEAKPVIRVSIGRLEVRTQAPVPTIQSKSSPPPKPKMTLEDYLNKQNNNGK